MKVEKTVTMDICDICKGDSYKWNECFSCVKNICYKCKDNVAHEYKHGIYVSGSENGLYCNECDTRLRESNNNRKHKAYRAVESLRREAEGWNRDFDLRCKKVEEELKLNLGEKI